MLEQSGLTAEQVALLTRSISATLRPGLSSKKAGEYYSPAFFNPFSLTRHAVSIVQPLTVFARNGEQYQ